MKFNRNFAGSFQQWFDLLPNQILASSSMRLLDRYSMFQKAV
jgi:hypothetical protein